MHTSLSSCKMSFFGSNPFVTPVGQRIEKATSEGLASEDWGLNMEICDIINETEEGPKDAIKAIKKRLLGNKNWKEVMFALTVLETCVKNCGHRFHALVCKQDFVKELVKIIQPSMNPPTVIQEKILSLIQSWADAFRTKPDLQGVVKVYDELKQKGIEFPATNLDELSPIVTPQRATPEVDPASRRAAPTRQNSQPQMQPQMTTPYPPQQGAYSPQQGAYPPQPGTYSPQPGTYSPQQGAYPPQQGTYPQQQSPYPPQQSPLNTGPIPVQPSSPAQAPVPAPAPAGLTPEQLAKLRRDLEMVLGNVRVMSEMLTEMVPGQEDPSDLQLLQDLNKTCRAMQQRVVELISSINNEEVTGELLRVNDDLNNVFVRYDRFERYRQSQTSQQPAQQMGVPSVPQAQPVAQPNSVSSAPPPYPASSSPAPPPAAQNTATLIDLGTDEPTSAPNAFASPAPVAAAGDMSQQMAGLDISGGAAPAVSTDEFDMFAQSRQTSYTDSRKSGSTYQDIMNLDQSGVTMGNLVNARANPFSAAPVAEPAQLNAHGLPPNVDVDEMEKWLNATDLEKANDGLAAQNTNSQEEAGITSSEFDQFLEARAKAADTLPSQTSQTRQNKMEEAENTMFAL
ncbi:TOM1-like protein 2 isoform X2 [Acanthaster planci]|uniref:TOM1-like protein 2 isoform X2 n=1 Tax=Acanthaster planci TaxID=133434 RepID=A0A8B7YGD9_ACAPL|nr:TOM1-like protein 2 isoform X2 [Acanthaster planci]